MGQLLNLGSQILGLGLGANEKTGSTQTQSIRNTATSVVPTEPGYFSDFRQSLVSPYQQYLQHAQQPVYGDAQRASFLNKQNQTLNDSTQNLASQMASRGGSLNSGAFASGANNLQMARQSNVANYDMSVPALNQSAYMDNMTKALGLGTQWAGRAPVGSNTTEASQLNSTTTTNAGSFLDSLGKLLASGGGSSPGGKSSPIQSIGSQLLNHFFGGNSVNNPAITSIQQGNLDNISQTLANYLKIPTSVDSTFIPAGTNDLYSINNYTPNGPGLYDPSNMSGLDWQSYFGNGFNTNDPSNMSGMDWQSYFGASPFDLSSSYANWSPESGAGY